MSDKYCVVCGCKLNKKNKTGYCLKHIGIYRTGENNPFYGKKHSDETKEILKIKCSIGSKLKWQDEEYRKKVIENATGLKRSEEFKQKQREHAIEQFKDKGQRECRSKYMTKYWLDGTLTPNTNSIHKNISKQEIEFIDMLSSRLDDEILLKETIHYVDENNNHKWFYPDVIIPKKNIIIEYNGSFWHADPNRYKDSECIIHDGIKASDIWKRDNIKKEYYEKMGYKLITVWGDNFISNKEECINETIDKINKI